VGNARPEYSLVCLWWFWSRMTPDVVEENGGRKTPSTSAAWSLKK
jgi:hypothetical protein